MGKMIDSNFKNIKLEDIKEHYICHKHNTVMATNKVQTSKMASDNN